jgi:hypothetical protein
VKTWHIILGLAVVGVAGVVVYKMTRPQLASGSGDAPDLDNPPDVPAPAPALPAAPAPTVVYVQPAPAAPAPAAAQPAAAYATSDPRDTAIDTSMSGWGEYESGGYH